MSQEIVNLDKSATQVSIAKHFGQLPIVSIKAHSFFKPSFWTALIPLHSINQLRDQMHLELSSLSTNFLQVEAHKSSHFVWVDQPDLIVSSVRTVISKINSSR